MGEKLFASEGLISLMCHPVGAGGWEHSHSGRERLVSHLAWHQGHRECGEGSGCGVCSAQQHSSTRLGTVLCCDVPCCADSCRTGHDWDQCLAGASISGVLEGKRGPEIPAEL